MDIVFVELPFKTKHILNMKIQIFEFRNSMEKFAFYVFVKYRF